MEVALKELEKKRLEYEKSPEKHPLYPDEWKIFWNRRYKELQAGLHPYFPHRMTQQNEKERKKITKWTAGAGQYSSQLKYA